MLSFVGDFTTFEQRIQPQCLISFKTGITGDEDFLSPEWHQMKYKENNELIFQGNVPDADKKMPVLRLTEQGKKWVNQSISDVWETELKSKPIELCTAMNKREYLVRSGRWCSQKCR